MLRENDYTEYCSGMGVINCVELTDRRFGRIDWLTEGLLKPGLSVLAGAPKIGKSWMVLQLCMAVAKGEPFLGMATKRSSVLYITLEDSETRLQERINRITEEPAENLYFAMSCSPLGEQLARELADFCVHHGDARLVVIDTFQKIREQAAQMSYSGDYADVSYLKRVADELNITVLLVHHTRKMGDSDVINEISGTNGIAGSADTLMILKKLKRSDSTAVLSCTGRDIEDRVMGLGLSRDTCTWTVVSDREKRQREELPDVLLKLIVYVSSIKDYSGSNTEFCRGFGEYIGEEVTSNRLKRLMNRYRYDLEDAGVYFISVRKRSGRVLAVSYKEPDGGLGLGTLDADEEAQLWQASEEEAIPLSDPDAEQEHPGVPVMWDDFSRTEEEIPLPGDDDAPPVRGEEGWHYCPCTSI